MENHLKNLFDFLKSCGHFKEFSSYENWREKKLGLTPPEKKKEDFRETLNEKEQKDFDFLFGEKKTPVDNSPF